MIGEPGVILPEYRGRHVNVYTFAPNTSTRIPYDGDTDRASLVEFVEYRSDRMARDWRVIAVKVTKAERVDLEEVVKREGDYPHARWTPGEISTEVRISNERHNRSLAVGRGELPPRSGSGFDTGGDRYDFSDDDEWRRRAKA